VEETDSILETMIRAMGIGNIHGRDVFKHSFADMHITSEYIRSCVDNYLCKEPEPRMAYRDKVHVPIRLPQNCAGCPHLFTYAILKKLNVVVASGIGCCGLSALPIMNASNIVQSMGSAPGIIHGMSRVEQTDSPGRYAAVFGDGELWHSGLMGIINLVYNNSNCKIIILDNDVIGMTGGQPHPSSQYSNSEKKINLNIKDLCKTLGIERVFEIDPYCYEDYYNLLVQEYRIDGISVIIAKKPCIRLHKGNKKGIAVIGEQCVKCGQCLGTGCPAIETERKGEKLLYRINQVLCIGCKLCIRVCSKKAIVYKEIENG
jgi:indolepyruvate ferredoxin oxidoreductase alpha subunit